MKKIIILIVLTVLLLGCISINGKDEPTLFKGITTAEIPGACLEQRDDVCGLFSCTVDRCWCNDATPEGAILSQRSGITVQTEAVAIIEQFTKENTEYQEYTNVKRAVKLNNIFYNVFTENKEQDEKVFTVAADGTIMLTTCGV